MQRIALTLSVRAKEETRGLAAGGAHAEDVAGGTFLRAARRVADHVACRERSAIALSRALDLLAQLDAGQVAVRGLAGVALERH